MIIPDINLLIYAINIDSAYHSKARKWLEDAVRGSEIIGLTWIVILGFIRITTNARILERPLSMETAFAVMDQLLELPSVVIVEPTGEHWKIYKELLSPLSTAGNLTSDAHLAAIAIQHRACLYSTDNDFSRFKGLRWKNPLA